MGVSLEFEWIKGMFFVGEKGRIIANDLLFERSLVPLLLDWNSLSGESSAVSMLSLID